MARKGPRVGLDYNASETLLLAPPFFPNRYL
jgi:hypothetical protein